MQQKHQCTRNRPHHFYFDWIFLHRAHVHREFTFQLNEHLDKCIKRITS